MRGASRSREPVQGGDLGHHQDLAVAGGEGRGHFRGARGAHLQAQQALVAGERLEGGREQHRPGQRGHAPRQVAGGVGAGDLQPPGGDPGDGVLLPQLPQHGAEPGPGAGTARPGGGTGPAPGRGPRPRPAACRSGAPRRRTAGGPVPAPGGGRPGPAAAPRQRRTWAVNRRRRAGSGRATGGAGAAPPAGSGPGPGRTIRRPGTGGCAPRPPARSAGRCPRASAKSRARVALGENA